MDTNKFIQLQNELGVSFRNLRLLQQAFTHSSYVNEHRQAKHNERLEFLGDAVLELAVSEYLYHLFPKRPEGELTKMRASIVCEPSLNAFAEELNFGVYILLGRGEEISGGRTRPALLADVFEAFIGALYLDQGLDSVAAFLEARIFSRLQVEETVRMSDHKSQLQEYIQQKDPGSLSYRLAAEIGPSHEKQFISEVSLNDQTIGTGTGRTKKESEQRAAAQALNRLLSEPRKYD